MNRLRLPAFLLPLLGGVALLGAAAPAAGSEIVPFRLEGFVAGHDDPVWVPQTQYGTAPTLSGSRAAVGTFSAAAAADGYRSTYRLSATGQGSSAAGLGGYGFAQTVGAGSYLITGVGDARPTSVAMNYSFDVTVDGTGFVYYQGERGLLNIDPDDGPTVSRDWAAGLSFAEVPADGTARRFQGTFRETIPLDWSDAAGGLVASHAAPISAEAGATDFYPVQGLPGAADALFRLEALTFEELGGASTDDLGWSVAFTGVLRVPDNSGTPPGAPPGGGGGGAGGAPVPEPSAVLVWLAAAAALTVGRRRLLGAG